MRRHLALLVTASVVGALCLAGCSDDTQDDAQEAVEGAAEDADEFIDTSSAQAVAAALQGSIEGDDRYEDEGPRSIAVIDENAGDLPGDPEVLGVADGDGDGLDDDGQVEIRVDDQAACLSLGEIGEGIDISNEACAPS